MGKRKREILTVIESVSNWFEDGEQSIAQPEEDERAANVLGVSHDGASQSEETEQREPRCITGSWAENRPEERAWEDNRPESQPSSAVSLEETGGCNSYAGSSRLGQGRAGLVDRGATWVTAEYTSPSSLEDTSEPVNKSRDYSRGRGCDRATEAITNLTNAQSLGEPAGVGHEGIIEVEQREEAIQNAFWQLLRDAGYDVW